MAISGPTTAQSGTTQTYTLTVTCSGSCGNTTVTFPTDAITDDGSTTDFGSWISGGTCSTLSVGDGQVTVFYPNLGSGSSSCNFTVKPPEFTTLGGAKITMTPIMTTATAGSVTGSPVTLTVTAGHNDSLTKTGPPTVASGGGYFYTLTFYCGANGAYTGDVGLSALTITDVLPAEFTYSSATALDSQVTLPGTMSYDVATHTFTYSDPTGASCGNPPLTALNAVRIKIDGTASTDGTPDAPGTQVCNTASSTFTYLDGTPATSTSPQACATVADISWTNAKAAASTSFTNYGQYKAPGSNAAPVYTHPGIWDGTGTASEFDIHLYAAAGATNAGLDYFVQDPMPCLDNLSGGVYSSNAPGTLCQHPAFIPTQISVQGFAPTISDVITVRFSDGTTQQVAYSAASGGWTIPTAKPVAQIDFPEFPEEGSNFGQDTFRIRGYVSPDVVTPSLLKNTETASAFQVGSDTPVGAPQTASDSLLVVSGTAPSGAVVWPSLTSANTGGCTESVRLNSVTNGLLSNFVEIASAPSAAIYLDYLAPVGATGIDGAWTGAWKLVGNSNGKTFTAAALSPNATPNYNGTGRTRYEWVIPAGTATTGGDYKIFPPNPALGVNLGPGCAGTYHNDLTVGYGSSIVSCLFITAAAGAAMAPPLNPKADHDLDSNGAGGSNYCGYSAPLTIAPINPAYNVDKVVQGNLDATPVGGGGIGHVSPNGGTATYSLSFTNTGQSNLTDPILYDLLPRIGDTEASSTDPRQSQFGVQLTGVGPVPTGVTVYYSEASNPCRPEVLPNSSNPGCTDDWTTTAPASLSSVTALKLAYDGIIYVSGSNAGIHSFTVPYSISTPDTSVGNVGWNSVGTSVLTGETAMPAAESAYTGLAAQASQPQVTKSADRSTFGTVGDTITYTVTVTNNTAVTLSPVTVVDKLTDAAAGAVAPTATCQALSTPAAACSGASATLAPNQVATFTATYTVTQDDLDHGQLTDRATATAQPPTGGALVNTSSPVTVTAVQTPELTVVKAADPSTVTATGDEVHYSFLVTNTGNVTVNSVSIDETAFSGSGTAPTPSCPKATLAPAEQETCTASYSVTQADLNAGSVTNTAHATGTAAGGQPVVSAGSAATVSVTQSPALSLVKAADPSSPAAFKAGQAVTYHFLVTNTGNVTVQGLAIDEGVFTGSGPLSAISCPATTLAPTDQVDCTASYTLTQADIDGGSVSNTAAATGTSPAGPVTSAPSSVTTPALPDAVLTLVKSANPSTVVAVGDVVHYSFLVTNTGNVTINTVEVQETAFSGTGAAPTPSCPKATLVPAEQETCTADYAVTQADLNAGSVTNTAHATGTAAGGQSAVSTDSSATVTVTQSPALSLVKSADPAGPAALEAGQKLTYHFLVANTGNVTVHAVSIDEGAFTGTGTLSAVSCPATTLAPTDQVDCTATYTLTQADVDEGLVSNTATATGGSPAGPVTSAPSTATTTVVASPALTLTKTADPTTVTAAGDVVHYSFLVTNTGNVTVNSVRIDETAFSGTGTAPTASCPKATLVPGDSETCSASYAASQADLDAGSVTNTAHATGTAAGGQSVLSTDSSATVSVTQSPALSLVKSAEPSSPAAFRAGQAVTYHFLVSNSGNVTVRGLAIDEGVFTGSGPLSAISCPATTLAPTDQVDCTATYALTQADIDGGSVSNTATATGTSPAGPVTSAASTASVDVLSGPSLRLVKSATPEVITKAGKKVTYLFAITNTGNVTIDRVAVKESKFTGHGRLSAISCPDATLAPGQKETCSASYRVTDADLSAGHLTNTARATGITGPRNRPVAVSSATSNAVVEIKAPVHNPVPGGHHSHGGSGGELPNTGAPGHLTSMVGGGAGLIAIGTWLLIGVRRRRFQR